MNKKVLMQVSFDEDNGNYSVMLGEGSSVPETAFSMAVVIKCLIKDGYLENKSEIMTLVNKYLDDPQYNELEEKENDEQI